MTEIVVTLQTARHVVWVTKGCPVHGCLSMSGLWGGDGGGMETLFPLMTMRPS